MLFIVGCLHHSSYAFFPTNAIFSSNMTLSPFSFLQEMASSYFIHLLILIKDLFIRMDIYRARNILTSKLQKKSLNIGINSQGHEPTPMDKPFHYAKYLTCQHQEFQQTSFLVATNREEGQARVKAKLEHPYSVFGLFVIKDGDTYHHQTGVIVHSNYAIITYSHPFQLEQGSSATFYPAINENSYRKAYRVNALVHDTKNAFAMIGLDTDEDLSQIYGKVDLEATVDRREGRQQYRERRRGRGYARRRGDDYRRQAPQHPLVIRYKILKDKIVLTYIPLRQDRYDTIYPEKGFLVQFDQEERMIVKSIVNNKSNNHISQSDLKALEERVCSEPKVLSCERMDLTLHQCIWIAERKWQEVGLIDMTQNRIGENLCFYLQNANWNSIKELKLSLNPIRDKGVYYLSKIDMPALEELELRNCKIQNEGCKWLSKGSWQHLKALNIRTNSISHEGCKWLKEANWPELKELNLKKNSIGRGCEYLATARWNLEVVQLGGCLIDDRSCKAIGHANWPSLIFLGLEDNIISNAGAKWLSKSNWKDLKFLLLCKNDNITKKGFDYLSKINANLLYKLSITNASYFPHNIYKLLKGEFPFLCKMHAVLINNIHGGRRDREDRYDVEKQVNGVTKIFMQKYQHCRVLGSDQYDEEDW